MESIAFWGDMTMWLYFPAKILSHSEGTWLYDYTFQPKIYPILRVIDYVIIISSQKSIPFWGDLTVKVTYGKKSITLWGDLTMWLYFPVKIYPILRGTDYVIILSSQKSIPFWGDLTMWSDSSQKSIPFWGKLTMWLYFPAKNLSHS